MLAENLRRIRKNAGYKSANQFATVLGIKYTTYIKYEVYGTWPSEEMLVKIADALNCTTDNLLGRKKRDNYADKYFDLKDKLTKILEQEG